MERDGLTIEEAKARMSSQPGDAYYEKRADHIIRNIGDTSALRLAVLELQNKLGL
jgi:dephospho-CoA kinase